MLGDQIYEGRGKITSIRVLEIEGADGTKTETSYTMQSKLKGIDVTETGTVISVKRSENKQYGQCKAIFTTQDGSTATMASQGIDEPTGSEK